MHQIAFILLQIKDSISTGGAKPALNLLELLMKGGVVMIPIAILLFITIYILFERSLAISKFTRSKEEEVNQFHHYLKKGEVEEAMALCKRTDNKVMKVLESGLQRLGRSSSEIESGMESKASILISKLQHKLSYLGIIAGIAPMLGFIGTISGIIRIFYDISVSENISISIIANGLYEKMVSSGSGLIVGIIAYAGYHYLLIKIDTFSTKVEVAALDFMNLIEESAS